MTKEKRPFRGTLYLTTSAAIAALYVLFTLPFAQFAFSRIQFRLAEIMVILPIFTPAAIPGITIGCFLANLLNMNNLGVIDIVFGSLATLVAAILTRLIARKCMKIPQIPRDLLAIFPPVAVNALIVGTYLTFLLNTSGDQVTLVMITLNILYVGISETVVVYALGYPFLILLRKSHLDRIWEKK